VKPQNERIGYVTAAIKYDQNGYKQRPRLLVATDAGIYIMNSKESKLKESLPYSAITGISVSSLSDGILVIHASPEVNGGKNKGDIIFSVDHVIEALTKMTITASSVEDKIKIQNGSIVHSKTKGKQGQIDLTPGRAQSINKGKNGHLIVTAPSL